MEQDYKTKEEIYEDIEIIYSDIEDLKLKVDECEEISRELDEFKQLLDNEGIDIELEELESNDLFDEIEQIYTEIVDDIEELSCELEDQLGRLTSGDNKEVPIQFFIDILDDIKYIIKNDYVDVDIMYVQECLRKILNYDDMRKDKYKINRKEKMNILKKQNQNKRLKRNFDIINLLKKGLTHKAIAKQYDISTKTIQRIIKEQNYYDRYRRR